MESENKTMTELTPKRRMTEGGIAFSVAIVLYMGVSLIFQLIASAIGGKGVGDADWYKYLAFLLPQLCFAGAALLFFRRTKVSPRRMYTPCKWWYFFIALALQFGLLFSLGELNGLFLKGLERIGYTAADASVTDSMVAGWYLLPAILIIALLPALFEETLVRGILLGGMRENSWGSAACILVSGAMFSLFHCNPEQTIYQFICGACYALLALRSGSVFPTMLAHFANNALVLILTAAGVSSFSALPTGAYLSLVIVSALCLVGVLVYLLVFERRKNVKGGVHEGKAFFFSSAVGIAVCAIVWLVTLVTGFLHG